MTPNRPLPPRSHLYGRLVRNFGAAVVVVAVWLVVGAVGYHGLEGLPWIDAFYNAAMVLTAMGTNVAPNHNGTKIFAICYALLSSIVFLGVVTLLLSPVVHRFLHRFHLESGKGPDKP